MRDMFDEFMEELRRKQAQAEGRDPGAPPTGDGERDPSDEDGDDEAPSRPRSAEDGGIRPPSTRRLVAFGIGFAIVIALLFFAGPGIDLVTDAMWYRSVGFETVFWTRVGTEFWLFVGAFAIALVVLLVDLWFAGRLAPPPSESGPSLRGWFDRMAESAREAQERDNPWMRGRPPGRTPGPRVVVEGPEVPDLTPFATAIIAGVAVLIALGIAGAAASGWETLLLWQNQVPFAPAGPPDVDPIFGRDIGFFLFDLPFLRFAQSLLNAVVLAALLVAGTRYLVGALRGGLDFTTPVRVHLGALGGLYLLSVAAGYQLDKFELVYASNGVATGVGYTDEAARFFAFDLLTIIAALAAALLVGGAFTKMLWPLGGAIVVWLGASVLVGAVYPELVQRFVVAPDPYANEAPYIQNNIDMTRLAYELDDWDKRDYSGDAPLSEETIRAEGPTFGNARLWDYRPLGDTIDQLQTVRQYYDFVDVDVDRYVIGDELRQVMLSARELDLSRSRIAQNWLNQKVIYTHGIGLVMVPVNEVQSQGQPRLWIRDLPPVSTNGAPEVDQPRIYFGEVQSDYVIVGARQDEFDYPSGQAADEGDDTGTSYRWTGDTGIRLDTTLTKLLFALRFRDLNLLISDQVTNASQLLFHRALGDRLPRIAPFLRFDRDPYLVVTDDGGLVYVQDAYTTSDRFPNAEYFFPDSELSDSNLGGQPFNYIRNSVKIVVDAYDGTTTFYAADPTDPILRAYEGVFPGVFQPFEALPEDLSRHLRVPEEQFNVQTRMFGRYHVTNPLTFFQRDDLWTVPVATGSDQSLPAEAYYVYMRMPGETEPEFLLLQPMVPTSRPNMIAWVAARMDGEQYGQVRYYQFPSNTTIFGPAQVEALIDQDPIISSQITLWNQSGSSVIRGNLLVVPIAETILYLQPVYLQSTASSFPEFQKIVLASPTSVVWADTLAEAIDLILEADGAGPGPSPSPTPTPSAGPSPSSGPVPTPPSGDVKALVAYANFHFELAQEALTRGDFATYGAEMALVEEALVELGQLVGTPVP
jgi:uncharacterized membrane protein (UPF0182 family)